MTIQQAIILVLLSLYASTYIGNFMLEAYKVKRNDSVRYFYKEHKGKQWRMIEHGTKISR